MNAQPAPRWRRLAPLTAAVLAAHGWLLYGPPASPPAARPSARTFATRSMGPPHPPPAPLVAERAVPQSVAGPPATALSATAPPQAVRDAPAPSVPAAPTPSAPAAPAPLAQSVAPAPHPPVAVPSPARHRYEVVAQFRGATVHGAAELEWRHDGHTYEARFSLRAPPLPLRTQRSTGRIAAEGLAPDYFAERARGEQATHFDREQQRVVFSANRPQAALAPGMQDRLSVLLQLAALVAGDPARYPAGARIALPTATAREASEWTFAVEGEEDLDLPGGMVRALKLRRPPRHAYDPQLELWLAARGDYAPVRLRLTSPNGDTVDHRWSATDRG